MDRETVQAQAQAACDALVAGDIERATEAFSPELKANLRGTGFEDRARVHQAAALRAVRGGRVRGPFDLVLADPPYADENELADVAAALAERGLLLPTSVVVFEQAATVEPLPSIGELPLANTRTHGQTRVSLYLA